eukprot:1759209-Amphidinium_carterae.1
MVERLKWHGRDVVENVERAEAALPQAEWRKNVVALPAMVKVASCIGKGFVADVTDEHIRNSGFNLWWQVVGKVVCGQECVERCEVDWGGAGELAFDQTLPGVVLEDNGLKPEVEGSWCSGRKKRKDLRQGHHPGEQGRAAHSMPRKNGAASHSGARATVHCEHRDDLSL